MRATTRLRSLFANDLLIAPGVYDGLSARLVEQAGFSAAYASGGAISRSTGTPDLGLMDLSENARRLEQIVDAVGIPVIGDADTGHGNALNAQRTARQFQRAGLAGFHIEDQLSPKKCGHYEDKGLVSKGEFVQKLKAIRDALTDDDFVVIARTDAIGVEGFESALDRARAYGEAGADVVFVEAPVSVEQIERVGRELPYPKLINMFHGGKTPMVPVEKLKAWGYAICIIPSDLQRAAIRAMQRTLEAIKRDGDSSSYDANMATFKEREAIVNTDAYTALDRKYAS